MTALSININKFALIRNSRGENNPDLLRLARQCLELGVAGITVHPRPDERHIRYSDLKPLRALVNEFPGKELNIEGYPSEKFLDLMCEIMPDQVTLVPDPPGALTSSFGWNMVLHYDMLKQVVLELQAQPIRVSLFIEAFLSSQQKERLLDIKPDRVELYTYDYAHDFPKDREAAVKKYREIAPWLSQHQFGINAGHDLSSENLGFFLMEVPEVLEVSIGQAFVCDCLQEGIPATVKHYLASISTCSDIK